MKSAIRFLGIIAIAAVMTLSMAACGDGAAGRPATLEDFQGKWVGLFAIEQGWSEYYVQFTGTNVELKSVGPSGNYIYRPGGTFTFTATHITFIAPPGTWTSYSTSYTLDGNNLRLHDGDSGGRHGWFTGPFTKQ